MPGRVGPGEPVRPAATHDRACTAAGPCRPRHHPRWSRPHHQHRPLAGPPRPLGRSLRRVDRAAMVRSRRTPTATGRLGRERAHRHPGQQHLRRNRLAASPGHRHRPAFSLRVRDSSSSPCCPSAERVGASAKSTRIAVHTSSHRDRQSLALADLDLRHLSAAGRQAQPRAGSGVRVPDPSAWRAAVGDRAASSPRRRPSCFPSVAPVARAPLAL